MELKFERGLWRESLRNFILNFLLILCVVGTLVILSLAQDVFHLGTSGNTGSTFAWIMLAIAIHATILKGQSGFSGVSSRANIGPFVGRAFAFAIVGLIGSMFTLPLVGDAGIEYIIMAMLPAYGLIEATLLSKWGTCLPAVIAEGDRSLSAAGKRGKVAFPYSFLRLLFCNGSVLAVSFIVLAIGIGHFSDNGSIWSQANGFNFAIFTLSIIFFLAFAFQTVMLPTVLSRAYLIAEAKLNYAIPAASAGIVGTSNTPA